MVAGEARRQRRCDATQNVLGIPSACLQRASSRARPMARGFAGSCAGPSAGSRQNPGDHIHYVFGRCPDVSTASSPPPTLKTYSLRSIGGSATSSIAWVRASNVCSPSTLTRRGSHSAGTSSRAVSPSRLGTASAYAGLPSEGTAGRSERYGYGARPPACPRPRRAT
jgi:hypothetical protein